VSWYRDVFPGRYYLELQEHHIPELAQLNAGTIALARELDVPLVATNDVHYARRDQADIHDVLLCIQTGKTVNAPSRMRMDGDSFYLKTAGEMASLFADIPDALTNTAAIADSCDVTIEFGRYHLPVFEVPEGYDAHSYLCHLCEIGLQQRYPNVTTRERDRLRHELDIIHRMGFDTYFLIVWDLCRFSREQGIWWNVRGSGASSIVAYCLGITNLEPLQHGLIFERFLNLGRVTMPDIDLDYPDDQRAQLIHYTIEKYGQEQVAQIITFGTMGAKAAIRDVGRALDYPLPEVDRIARLVPGGPKVKLDTALRDVSELREQYEGQEHIRRLIDTARGVEGNIRHASTHAAGVIVSDVPLVEYVPLHRPTSVGEGDEIRGITQYTMSELDELGLLKIDFLGLSTLTIMRRACKLIHERYGFDLDLDSIPIDDPATYDLLSRGDVMGVFQVEGQGMRRVLMKMQPSEFDHIVATISLFRPGPMEHIDDYIDRMHGRRPVEYRHPSLEPVLQETFGIIVYQEQIIQLLTDIAGYTASEADLVRRAVGKKKKAALLDHRFSFVEGSMKHSGLPREAAEGIFDDIEYFARYGFNKSHAADYAVLTCQTAFLKAKYAVEYMAALLSVERNNTEKIGLLIAECRRMGIRTLPPDVNQSNLDFAIEDQADGTAAIRFGMGAVKNVGEGPVNTILAARKEGGHFTDLDDFCRRVDMRQVNRRALESLIKVGALRPLGMHSQLLPVMDHILGLSASLHRARDVGQMSLFGETTGLRLAAEDTLLTARTDGPQVPKMDILGWEKELIGAYVSEHPMTQALLKLRDVVSTSIGALTGETDGQQVVVAGMLQRARRHITRKGDEMAFVTLEDLDGVCDVVVFPRVWARTKQMWRPERVLVVGGKLDAKRRDEPSLLCDWVKTPDQITLPLPGSSRAVAEATEPPPVSYNRVPAPAAAAAAAPSDSPEPPAPPQSDTVFVTVTRLGEQRRDVETLRTVHRLLVDHPGQDHFVIRLVGGTSKSVELTFPNDKTHFCPELARELAAVVGRGAIRVVGG
jgi:DNA polymerase-3 subunit alpha